MAGKSHFLAVDDDPAFLIVLTRMMQDLGYVPPDTAASGVEALARLDNPDSGIDSVLLDIQMPEMDGIETCHRIRAMARHRETPIMMVTTMKGRNFVDYAFAAGATDYLTKPLDKIELNARLGMVERLIHECRRARFLKLEMDSLANLPGLVFKFEDPVPLPHADPLIDYIALQNHLLTLNRLRLHSYAAVGFRVVNAAVIFQRVERVDYLDYMADVGDAITAAFKRHKFLLAHAGSGEFVSVVNRTQPVDRNEIEQDIAAHLLGYRRIYHDLDLPIPVISVGTPQHSGMVLSSAATRILERARGAARIAGGFVPAEIAI